MQPLCGAYINDDLNVDHPIVNKASSSSSTIIGDVVVIGVCVLAGGFVFRDWYKAEYGLTNTPSRFS